MIIAFSYQILNLNLNLIMKITVSKEAYSDKTQAKAAISMAVRKNYKSTTGNSIKAIKWNEISVDPKDFYNLILQGYTFTTGLYKTKLYKSASSNKDGKVWKKDASGNLRSMIPFDKGFINNGWILEEFWNGSYCIFADIDETKSTSIEDYCSHISPVLTPTFGFYSPSDKPDKRRFKLVWIFNLSINDSEFWKAISNYINNELSNIEQLKDKCGTTITQISYGNKGGSGVWFGNTYDPWMFDWLKNTIKTDEEKEAEDNGKEINDIQIDQDLIDTLKRNFPFDDLKYIDYVDLIWRKDDLIDWISPSKFPLASIGLCKKDYWELDYNFGVKIKDGGQRRKKLFMRMCLRRLLKPTATSEEILINAYRDRDKIIDNSDGVVSVDNLIRNVKVAFSYEIEELEDMFKSTIEYLKQKSPLIVFKYYKGRKGKYTREEYKIIKGKFTQYLISQLYDPNLSDAKNIEKFNKSMEEWGYTIRISDRKLLLKYRKENKIEKNNDRDEFILEKHNEGLSATEIMKALEDNGFESMSKRQINRIIAKFKNNTNNNTEEIRSQEEEPENEIKLEFTDSFNNWKNNSPKEVKEEPKEEFKEEFKLEFTDYFKKWANL